MGITGSLFQEFAEQENAEPFSRQNSKLLRVRLAGASVWARAGSMVACQGSVAFVNKGSGGLSKMFKQAVTGEGAPLMKCTGNGDLFLADGASDVQILHLNDDEISVNGRNVLAFDESINWDIHRINTSGAMLSGDLYNVSLRGTGYVAITTKGEPVALRVGDAPTFGDPQAVVLWTAGVGMDVRVDSGGLGSMIRGGSGETLQMAFRGEGYVLVQPSEYVAAAGSSSSSSSGGGFLDQLFGD